MSEIKTSETVEQWIDRIAKRFEQADVFYGHGTECAIDEAAYLVLAVLGLPFNDAGVYQQRVDSTPLQQRLEALTQLRIEERIPVAYLVNQAWFAGIPFYVDERVLIPRSPIAELIQNRFRPWLRPEQLGSILEIGTGSGCIAIAMAEYLPEARIVATDDSDDALQVARRNVELLGFKDRVELQAARLFDGLPAQQFDLIISNPPYVPEQEWTELPAEYHHEPKHGLTAGEDGLEVVTQMLNQAAAFMHDDSVLIVEVGFTQPYLEQAFPRCEFTWIEFENGGQGVFMLTRDQLSCK